MGTGAVATIPIHAQALYLLMNTADAEYAQGAKHLRLGVFGQGVPAQPLLKADAQWLASTRAMLAASSAAKPAAQHAPLVGVERLAQALSDGYTHAHAVAQQLGLAGVDADLDNWANEVMDWSDVLHARKSPASFKVMTLGVSATTAQRRKATLNRNWADRLNKESNDKKSRQA